MKAAVSTTLLFSLALTSCKEVKDVEFRSLRDFRIVRNEGKADIRFDVVLFNPNTFGFRVGNTEAEVFINDRLLGKALQSGTVRMDATSEAVASCEFNVAASDLLKLLPSGLEAFFGGRPLEIRVRGKSVASKSLLSKRIDFDTRQQFDGKQLRSLF
ncbi:MAG: hypothetical protein RL213_2066 [Bacteroidota bacterium]